MLKQLQGLILISYNMGIFLLKGSIYLVYFKHNILVSQVSDTIYEPRPHFLKLAKSDPLFLKYIR